MTQCNPVVLDEVTKKTYIESGTRPIHVLDQFAQKNESHDILVPLD